MFWSIIDIWRFYFKVLLQQQQSQIDEEIEKAQNENVLKQAEENNIRLSEFDAILQPIIDSCTKDSISGGENVTFVLLHNYHFDLYAAFTIKLCNFIWLGKNWILQHAGDAAKCHVLMQYLLKK